MKQSLFIQSATRTTLQTVLAGLLIGTTIAGSNALAEGVKIFTGPPPAAEELAAMLFSSKSQSEAVRTRSIVFINQDNIGKAPAKSYKSTQKITKETKKKTKRSQQANAKKTAKHNPKGFGFLISFKLNSSTILADSRPYLDQVGKMMRLPEAASQKLVIEGHTDASGSAQYNKQLSVRRAQAVKQYLVKKHQVSAQQLVAVGKGEMELLPNRNPRDGMNRRVQFHTAKP